MKLRNVAKSFAIAAAILCASHANAQNVELATNLGFEDPIGADVDTASDQWNPFAGGGAAFAAVDMIDPLAGANHAVASILGDNDAFAGVQYQIDGITPGADYTLSLSARSEGVDLGGVDAEFRIEFLDANGDFVGGQFDNNEPIVATDTYAPFTQTQTAPFAAVSLRAVIAVQSFGAGLDDSNSGALFIDSTSIQGPPIGAPPTPAPTPMPGPVMELATNLSFEDPIGAPGDTLSDQWNPFDNGGNTFAGLGDNDPLTGLHHGVASITGDDASFAGLQYQVDGIVPGEPYTFSFSARSEGVNLGGIDAEFRIEYLDSTGAFVEDFMTNNAAVVATNTYAPFTQTNTAPVGAVSLRAVIAVQSFGAGLDASDTGALFVDDASIQGSLDTGGVVKGDADMYGHVDFDDIPAFITILQSGMFVAQADADCDLDIDFDDIPAFIVILQSQ